MNTRYVCGYAFNADRTHVALVLKNRPEFLNGWYNPVGGHYEDTDINLQTAMAREFKEETNCDTTPEQWKQYAIKCIGTDIYVHFLFTVIEDDAKFLTIQTNEDEPIFVMDVKSVLADGFKIPHDARVLLMDAAYRDLTTDHYVTIQEF